MLNLNRILYFYVEEFPLCAEDIWLGVKRHSKNKSNSTVTQWKLVYSSWNTVHVLFAVKTVGGILIKLKSLAHSFPRMNTPSSRGVDTNTPGRKE